MLMQPTEDGRTRRRLIAMRRVQDVAMGLFIKRGFVSVTVEEVARAAEVGVASVFRNFGTKENLVLWDEYDPLLLEAMKQHLRDGEHPLVAVRHALSDALGNFYERDRKRILARADLIVTTPALHDASRKNLAALRVELVDVIRRGKRKPLEAQLLAGVIVSTLEVAVEEWRRLRGRETLRVLLARSFDTLLVLLSLR